MNLAHRGGNAGRSPVTPGERVRARITLDARRYRLVPAHRPRLALSTTYRPTIPPRAFAASIARDLI